MPPQSTSWRWPLLIGVVGWLAVMATRSDPGITSDEPFDVVFGKDLVARFLTSGARFFEAESIQSAFGTRPESRQHPPLGRWLIGWIHWVTDPRPRDPEVFNVLDARAAPATAFAVTLMLIAHATARRRGTIAGVAAGVSLLLMPRVFADAHFAALDTVMSWTFVMGVLSAGWMMEGPRPWLRAPAAGVLLGCAMLTKLHGFFLLPLVGAWALTFHRRRALLPLSVWLIAGAATFVVGWQWLWHDTLGRIREFLATGVHRQVIHVWYFGRTWRDVDLPWHYPWVMFAVTVPVGLHVLGILGARRQWRMAFSDPWGWLVLSGAVFPIVIFSVPRVPVYDGVRMFLMIFPLWAVFVGQGASDCFDWLRHRWQSRWAGLAVAGFLACQSFGLIHYHPFQLSYYNLLVGGLWGAERLGFEVTYWGDTVTRDLINGWSEQAPRGSCAVLSPALYEAHPLSYETNATATREQHLTASLRSPCRFLIVYNRRAYLSDDEVNEIIERQHPLLEKAIDGVWLSRVYERPAMENSAHEPAAQAAR